VGDIHRGSAVEVGYFSRYTDFFAFQEFIRIVTEIGSVITEDGYGKNLIGELFVQIKKHIVPG
jgi:hypothetical protein